MVTLVAAAFAQDDSQEFLTESSATTRFGMSWADRSVTAFRGTIRTVQVTRGETLWMVDVTETFGAWAAPLPLTIPVVQPRGCGEDGLCTTSFNGVINTDLSAGDEILVVSSKAPPASISKLTLDASELFFRYEAVTVRGRKPVSGFSCDAGPASQEAVTTKARTIAAFEQQRSTYLLPEARVDAMAWTAFLDVVRTCFDR